MNSCAGFQGYKLKNQIRTPGNGDLATATPSASWPRAAGVAVLARFPPKVHDGPDSAASDLLGKQQLAVEAEGHLNAPVKLSEHSSPLSGFLKLSQPI